MSRLGERIAATVRLVPVILILSVLRAAAVDQREDIAAVPENSHVNEKPDGITWRWSWDQGVRYDVEVPFDQYWIGAERRPLTDTPIEKRLAFIGKIGAIVQVDAAGYGENRGLEGATSGTELRRFRFGTTGNLLIDIDAALLQHAPLRVYSGALVPAKSAMRSDWPLPELADDTRQHAAARQREDAYRAALAGLYHYDLFSHNCVTEIFRTMESALTATASDAAPNPGAVRAASSAALGGYVEWRRTLNFIPFLSARAVSGAYRVSARVERPSSRSMKLEQMYQRENALRVDLRESNVLTARSYERGDDDPIFLFFTDDVLVRWPLYGIANLAVGIGGTLAGLAWLPVDRGVMLRAGLDGALFSVPEIAFINIRKGSFAFAPRRWLGDDGASPWETSDTRTNP